MSLHTGRSVRQFPESDTTSSRTEGAESSNGTEAQSQSQSSVKPFGSAAARFKIRSAKTLTTKDLRTKSFSFESGKVEDSRQKSDPSKDLNRVCSSSSGSYTNTNTGDKHTGRTLTRDTNKNSTLPISSEKGDVSDKKLNTPEDKSQQVTANDRSRGDELRRFYQTNKSKSLDWRGSASRAGDANRTLIRSGTRDLSTGFERTGTNMIMQQENQPSSVSWRIQAYKPANQGDQSSDRKVCPVSGSTSVRLNRVTFAMERANSGQSLPTRLKPRLSQGSVGEGRSLWPQKQGELGLHQIDNRTGSWDREQGHSNPEEVSGNQTIKERIEKLFRADVKSDAQSKTSIRLKRSNTLSSDISLPTSMDNVNSAPSDRKYTTYSVLGTSSDSSDSQQGKPSYNTNKAGTFPRGFSTTNFGPKQEPSNDQMHTPSGLQFSVPTKPKCNTDMSSVKKVQSPLPDDSEEKSRRWTTVSPKYNSQSLDRARSRQSATAQYNTHRNQAAWSDSSSSISNQGVKHLLTTSGGIKEEIGKDKHSDKETAKRFDIIESRYLGGLQDVITQPKYPLASKGAAHNEIQKEEDKDDVFSLKTEGRRGEGVLEKLRVPSLDSVRNTISMFESLAQQSKSAPQIPRRALSVPDHPKPYPFVKKSNSDKNLNFGKGLGNTESMRTNFFGKKETEDTVDLSITPHSNSRDKVRQFKHTSESRPDQDINKREEDTRMTVNKKYTNEADFDTPAPSGLRNNGATDEKAGLPISQQPNVSLFKQQTTEVYTGDADDENTPTNSPDKAPAEVIIQQQSNTQATNVNGTNPKVLSNLNNNFTPAQTIYSSLNSSNNNNHNTTRNDLTTLTTRMARWSSDEEDYYDEDTETEEDSDSGESSVTITSNMSQTDRRSFSLSYVDLCNFGGVEYKDGSLSEDYEELPSSRSASLSSDISAFSSVTLLSTEELDRLLDDVRGLGDDTLKKYEDVQVVVLHKEVGSGLGFTLAGGVDQNKPVTVHRIIPDGAAAQEGSIFEGAQVLSINGTSLQNSAHWEALRTLRKARGQAMAVVVLQSASSRKEATERQGVTGRRVRVTLNKSSSDLGFSLEGGVGSSSGDKPLTVQKIFRGGPIGDVFPGDELLEVQGRSLAGMMRLEAWNLIKKLPPGPVEVLLHRPQQPR